MVRGDGLRRWAGSGRGGEAVRVLPGVARVAGVRRGDVRLGGVGFAGGGWWAVRRSRVRPT